MPNSKASKLLAPAVLKLPSIFALGKNIFGNDKIVSIEKELVSKVLMLLQITYYK